MLFDRRMEPRCAYCVFGDALNPREVACVKRGIVSAGARCGKFSYEPTKRVPEHPPTGLSAALGGEDLTI
jgi:hypothetical protein